MTIPEKDNRRLCPICCFNRSEILHHQNFILPAGHPMTGGYDVICCRKCGFVFADIGLTQEDLNSYYAEQSKYADQKISSGSGESAEDIKRLKDLAKSITKFFSDPTIRILEIGCANGGLLRELKQLGYTSLTGIDPSPDCVAHTREIGLEAFVGNLSFLPIKNDNYDLVILSHVFEHLIDLHLAVENLRKVCKGAIWIEVPDAVRYHEYVNAPFQDFNTEHINHFSHLALRNLFNQHGYNVIFEGDKQIEIGKDKWMSAIYSVFTSSEKISWSLTYDEELNNRMQDYIEISSRLLKQLNDKILDITSIYPTLIVWGTGQLAMKLLAETVLGNVNIIAFIDSNPINHGKILLNKPILDPLQLVSSTTPILITTTIHSQAIQDTIRNLSLENPIITL